MVESAAMTLRSLPEEDVEDGVMVSEMSFYLIAFNPIGYAFLLVIGRQSPRTTGLSRLPRLP